MEKLGELVLVNTLRLRRGEVTCVDIAGVRLVGGSGDGTLRLWRWSRDLGWIENTVSNRAHRYGVTGTRFAPSGILLASIGIDGTARIWCAREALVARNTLAAPDAAAARSILWVTSDKLVVGHDDGGIRVWMVRLGTLLAYVRAHEGALYALATLDNVALLLSACTEGVLKVFDFEDIVRHGTEGSTGPAPLLWEDGAHDLGVLCATQHLRYAATGGHDGRVRLWRVVGAGRERRVTADATLTGHTAAVTALHWVRDLLASASLDRTARLWDAKAAVCIRVLQAHSRYLTCIALATDIRFMITGSNDKSVCTWSLGNFSLQDHLDPACNPLVHFALGDLEGIGPVDDDITTNIEEVENNLACVSSVARCVVREPHAAAINSIAVSNQMIATACSDGHVRVFSYHEKDETLQLELELFVNSYPVLAVDFGANGALLLSGGLDGCARLWDVQSGCELAALPAASAARCGEGGGGVRDARVSPHRPPLLLLASDDGLAALWSIDPPCPDPIHVYLGLAEAALCCAWSEDGRVLVTGGEAGELHLLAPPPQPTLLCQQLYAHDLGVLSCDFAENFKNFESEDESSALLLATGGRDALVKLWWVTVNMDDARVEAGSVELACSLPAHGGAVQCVRWGRPRGGGEGELTLATGGADRWARVWRVSARGGRVRAQAAAAVPSGAAGGAPAVRLLGGGRRARLAVGSLSGELAVWRVPDVLDEALRDAEGAEPRFWSTAGVKRWLREYVTGPPGSSVSEEQETRLLDAASEAALTGAKLLDAPLAELLNCFGYGGESGEDSDEPEEVRERLLDEILWLRRDPLPYDLEDSAPHALRCPLTHAALREPARAADGFTYERQSILDWILAADTEEVQSPLSGRRLASALVEPNYGVRDQLRAFCGWRR
ncbi:unnamed protein product [Euphydryas editha]|uniref:U-box domain-containing protein n=1 Tax=Euphydryas editha TaxID=104508 RepID=A0AAU9TK65_EUPED|nr:unnamed protein product [Euphydryas editha]